jgi:hypothetical protein
MKFLGTINMPVIAGDPTSPNNGDMWYNSTRSKYRKKENGVISDFDPAKIVVGDLYNKTTWANLTDFAENTVTATISGSSIQFPVTQNTGFTSYLAHSAYTCINHWKMIMEWHMTSTPGAATNGVSLGLISKNSFALTDCAVFFNMSTTNKGRMEFFGRTNNGAWSSLANSGSAVTFSANDVLRLTIERVNQTIYMSAENLTTLASSVYWSYTYLSNNNLSIPPNTSRWAVYGHGGIQLITKLQFINKETLNPNVLCVGDSKTLGYGASSFDKTYPFILDKNYTDVAVAAGFGDRITDVQNRVTEILAINPNYIILSIGSNDKRNAVSDATTQTNYAALVTSLIANGAKVLHLPAFSEVTQDNSNLNTYVKATYPNDYVDTFNLPAIWGRFTDNIHLSDNTNQKIVDLILDKNVLIGYNRDMDALFQRDSGELAYGGTFSNWVGTTAPTGTVTGSYHWFQIGKVVMAFYDFKFATAGTAITAVDFTVPSDLPVPLEQVGANATNDVMYTGTANINALATNGTNGKIAIIKTGTGTYKYNIAAAGSTAKVITAAITYIAA